MTILSRLVLAPGLRKIAVCALLALPLLAFTLLSTASSARPLLLFGGSFGASASTREQIPTAAVAQAGAPQLPSESQGSAQPGQPEKKISAYTLPPDLYRKAKTLSETGFIFDLVSFFYGLFILWLVLHWRIAPLYRNWAERVSSNRFLQAFLFTSPLIVTIALLQSPTAIFEHIRARAYGLSVEGWGALAWDWTKGILILIVLGSVLAWILYAVIRLSPRRWWFYFWLISVPMIVFLSFVEPFLLEPLFFKFAPLQQKDPALVTEMEAVVHRAGLDIPPDRMFWMKASDKTPLENAYVTGIGASKRIVVWDTTIEKETTPEIVSVIGHEMGHYVLGHVWKGLIFSMVLLFVLLFLGYRCIGWVLAKWGYGWGIRGLADWASLPALLLLLSIFSFVSDPISNAYSRHVEHQADQYGLEVTHGILPDPGQAAADSFQVEGESALADPNPNPVQVFLFYDHPPISDRVRFCLTYDPWSDGRHPEFVK